MLVARGFFDCASGMAAVLEEAMRRGAGSVGDDDVAARRAEEAGEFGSWAPAARIARAESGGGPDCLVSVVVTCKAFLVLAGRFGRKCWAIRLRESRLCVAVGFV